ncbi:MAG: outer membrane homotrimeric porin [Desulfovibrionaceae bacterium]
MKKLMVLAILGAFCLGLAGTASAIVDVKATGDWQIAAIWRDGFNMRDIDAGNTESDFDVWQRVRTYFQFIANENLKGVFGIEIGTANWGGAAMPLGADQTGIIEVKHAYVDFTLPNTKVNVKAGLMPLALPSGAFGNAVLDDDVAAAVVSTPLFDHVGLLAGWARPYQVADSTSAQDSELDMIFAAVPLTFDGVSVTPYLAYAYSGSDTLMNIVAANGYGGIPGGLVSQNATQTKADDVSVWWGGAAFNVSLLDPFGIKGGFVYGDEDGDQNLQRSGWEFDIALSYTGWDFVTPELYFVYTSGEDGNASDDDGGDSERLPTVSTGLAPGTFWTGKDFFGDARDVVSQSGAQCQSDDLTMGYWALGLNLKDISFLEGLTHQVSIAYFEGTNDKNIGTAYTAAAGGYGRGVRYTHTLTEDDSLVEYSLLNRYKVYDQLTLALSLSYLDVSMDRDNWAEIADGVADDKDAYKVLLGVQYKF